jgi:hypothetical protein
MESKALALETFKKVFYRFVVVVLATNPIKFKAVGLLLPSGLGAITLAGVQSFRFANDIQNLQGLASLNFVSL